MYSCYDFYFFVVCNYRYNVISSLWLKWLNNMPISMKWFWGRKFFNRRDAVSSLDKFLYQICAITRWIIAWWRKSEFRWMLEWQGGNTKVTLHDEARVTHEWNKSDSWVTKGWSKSNWWMTHDWHKRDARVRHEWRMSDPSPKSDKRVIYDRPLSDATVTHWSWKDAYRVTQCYSCDTKVTSECLRWR